MDKKIAVVTGANRGMGKAVSEKLSSLNYHVIMIGRHEKEINEAAHSLSAEAFVADVENEKDILELTNHITTKYGHLDVLINNAGVYIQENNIFTGKDSDMKKTFEINTMGPYRLMKGLIPLMQKNGYGRVVNVSSGLGSFEGFSVTCPAYSVSKVALNMLTKLFSSSVDGKKVKVNSICPGWVKTDMGGPNASRSIEEGISGMIWAATLPEDGPNGGFFRDGKPIEW